MLTHLLFIFTLILIGIVDAVTRKIPDYLPFLIVFLSVCRFIQNPAALIPGIAGLFAVSVPLLLLSAKTGGLGGGDIKLTAACGLFLGPDVLLLGMFFAALLALAAFALRFLFLKFLIYRHRPPKPYALQKPLPQNAFAFGPYIATGLILAALTG